MDDQTDSADQLHGGGPLGPDQPRLAWKAVAKRLVMVAIAGVALYFVAPKLIDVFASFPRLKTINFIWLALALVAQAVHFACTFALQRIALRTRAWFPVVTAQLAGNAISLIMPGGAAVGAAVQFRMLSLTGMETGEAVGGLTAFSLLGIASLLFLPVFALPVILFGAPINRSLYNVAILAVVAFFLFAGFGAALLMTDAPIRWVGQTVQRARNRLLRRRPPMRGLEHQLVEQRDLVRSVLGKEWWKAVLLSAGRVFFDLLTLVCALRAVGSHPQPSLVLIAYALTGIIGLVPITPGGLGIVEASLTGFLVLAGVPSVSAVLATLTYRLASYWLPMLAGPVAYVLFKYRYRSGDAPPSGSTQQSPA